MLIDIKYLKEGCILSKDVLSKTSRPIMLQNTIITKELLKVLHAFLIKEVSVEKIMVNGEMLYPSEIIDSEDTEVIINEISFINSYLQSVQEFKSMFKGWQAGNQINVPKARGIFVPLLEKALENEEEIFSLHHYSTMEDYFYHHSISVGLISGYIAKKLHFSTGDVLQVAIAGCLSDAGMAKIHPSILEKKSALTFEEFNEIKKHPIYTYRMLEKSPILRKDAMIGILQHHERLDGSGYPKGDKGRLIHINSRIIGLSDVFHAMTSERVYRKKQSPFKVLEMIMQDHFGKFDLQVVNALLSGVIHFSIGTKVKLSNGYEGEVMFIDTNYPTRPTIKIEGLHTFIDLNKERDIFIEKII